MKFPIATTTALVLGLATFAGAQTDYDDVRFRLPGRGGIGVACVADDLNGDGLTDIVRAAGGNLEILTQNASGQFDMVQGTVPLGLGPGASVVSLCTGQFRPGGILPDLIVGVTGQNSVIFDNNEAGRFARRTSELARPVGFSGATTQVLVGDIDRQNGDDIIVLHDSVTPQVYLQQPGGSFVDMSLTYFPALYLPLLPVGVLSDFDGDQFPDLIVIRRGISATPTMWRSLAGIGFQPAPALPGNQWIATQATAGDVTQDGVPDLVLTSTEVNPGIKIYVNDGAGNLAAAPVPFLNFGVGPVRDLGIGSVVGTPDNDLVILEIDGRVSVAPFDPVNGYAELIEVMAPGSRSAVQVVNLEPSHDNDDDLYVLGWVDEDGILLSDGASMDLLSTEEITVASGSMTQPNYLELLDVSGEGDLDIVGYDVNGGPIALVNDGADRFRPGPQLPDLTPASILDVAPLQIGPANRGLAVLGTRPGGANVGVNILGSIGNGLADQTAIRWPVFPSGLTAFAVGDVVKTSGATAGLDDIVAIDSAGVLHLFQNTAGNFSEVAGFSTPPITGAVQLILGMLDANARVDLVVLRQSGPPVVFLGQVGGSFARVPTPILGSFPASRGILTDLTGDGQADIVIASRSGSPSMFVLKGNGDGTFVDQAGAVPPGLPPNITSVAVVGGSEFEQPQALVISSSSAPDLVYPASTGAFTVANRLPQRGSPWTTKVLVGDLDTDGDQDLVMCRAASMPRIWFDQSYQLTARTLVQLNRPTSLRVRGPAPGSVTILLGAIPTRLPVSNFGLLRIDPALLFQLLVLPVDGVNPVDVPFPTSNSWVDVELLVQPVFVDNTFTKATFGNLEAWTMTYY